MSGLGYFLGGALNGIGQGIAKQGELDAEQRRQMALENLRSSNSLAQEDRRSANQMAENAAQAEDTRKTDQGRATLDDWKDARHTDRTTSSTMKIDQARQVMDVAKMRVSAAISEAQRANDTQRAIQLQTALRQLEGGDIKDVVASGDGRYYGITKSGQKIDLGITASDKQLYSGSGSNPYGGLTGGGGAGSPTPASPGAKVPTTNW